MSLAAFTMWAVTAFTAPTVCDLSDACAYVDMAQHDTGRYIGVTDADLDAMDAEEMATDAKSSAPVGDDCRNW